MAAINSLQQSQINLLKTIFSLADIKARGLEYVSTPEEFTRILESIEETLFDGLKVIAQMDSSILISVHPIMQNVLNNISHA